MNTFQAWIGYARTFTVDPNLDAQIQALTAVGCGIVSREQRGGTTLEGSPELKSIVDFIHVSPVFRPSKCTLFDLSIAQICSFGPARP